jgi:hypothetical protein
MFVSKINRLMGFRSFDLRILLQRIAFLKGNNIESEFLLNSKKEINET